MLVALRMTLVLLNLPLSDVRDQLFNVNFTFFAPCIVM